MAQQEITAALILIGNEILSGRTQDKNLNYIAKGLNKVGVRFKEVRVIPDEETTIIETVQALSQAYNYVFTTGGIGPTHDDITSESVAKAFNTKLTLHPEAKAVLEKHYSGQLNESRLRMGYVPEGANLIPNPVSGAPGFVMHNVYVMAGIPNIMQAMFDHALSTIEHGQPLLTKEVTAYVSESAIANELTDAQERYPNIEIGSYPFVQDNKIGVTLVMRSTEKEALTQCEQELATLLKKYS